MNKGVRDRSKSVVYILVGPRILALSYIDVNKTYVCLLYSRVRILADWRLFLVASIWSNPDMIGAVECHPLSVD
jgi:hypothetical protein